MNDVLNRPVGPALTFAYDRHSEGESVVIDARANLRPAEMVERKLVNLLKATPLAVSKMQAALRKR